MSKPRIDPLRCWAEVDLEALRHNATVCGRIAGPACELMAIVKADAYGHGLERVVEALADSVPWFGVANLAEARRAERAAAAMDRRPSILVLSTCLPDEREHVVAGGFAASISTAEELDDYGEIAARRGETARLHLVVDTGMGRMGCLPEQCEFLRKRAQDLPGVRIEGVASHFPSADEDSVFTRQQIDQFRRLAMGGGECYVHLANSAGLLGFSREIDFAALARPGLAIYGISPLGGVGLDLRPALSLRSRVTLVRDLPAGHSISYGRTFVTPEPMRVATLGFGYGDGYPRHLSGTGAAVLIGGRRCPLLGRVTMDQVVVDVSMLPERIAPGDEAVLIGRQGDEEITAVELAERAGTIPWEILTGITSRVERLYRETPSSPQAGSSP